jgi:hypothetical protein
MILQTHSTLLHTPLYSSLPSRELRPTTLHVPNPRPYRTRLLLDLTGPGLPLKTATCKNLCNCVYRGTGTLTVTCQRYSCCSNLDVFTACENHGQCSCQRDAKLLQANATTARRFAEGVMDLGGAVRNVVVAISNEMEHGNVA